MQVIAKIEYTEYTADLTGQELDTLTKILGKLTKIYTTEVVDGVNILVEPAEPSKIQMELRIIHHYAVWGNATYAQHLNDKKRAAIAQAVAKFLDGGEAGDFIDDVYYQSVITYSEHKAERGPSTRRDVGSDQALVSVIDDDAKVQIITINRDGTYTRSEG